MSHDVSLAEFEGPLRELREQCSGRRGRERFNEFNLWLKKVTVEPFEFIKTVSIPGINRFVAAEVIGKTGTNRDGVDITYISTKFNAQFGGLVEENVESAELAVSRLIKSRTTAIGLVSAIQESKRAVRLSQIYQLVRDQTVNGKGPLLTNRLANLFLAYGTDDNLSIVIIYCIKDSWYFDTRSLGSRKNYYNGYQVFFLY